MKKALLKGLVLTLGALVISGTTSFASVLGVAPEVVEGNDSNHSSHIHSMESEKIDPPTQGSHLLADGRIEVVIKDSKLADVIVLDESINVEFVHMKGSNSFNCYDYVGEPLKGLSQEADLICPTNNSGKNADISHITIYWEEVETETTPEVEYPTMTLPGDFEIVEEVKDGTSEDNNVVTPEVEHPTTTIPDDFEVPEVSHPAVTIPDSFEVPEVEQPTMTIPDSFEVPEIVGDGTQEDNNVVTPEEVVVVPPVVEEEEEVVVTPPVVEEPTVEEEVVVTPPIVEEEVVVEEVPQVEETVKAPELPYTGGTDSIILVLGAFGMVGTGLKLFKRK